MVRQQLRPLAGWITVRSGETWHGPRGRLHVSLALAMSHRTRSHDVSLPVCWVIPDAELTFTIWRQDETTVTIKTVDSF